ncbi:MAG: PD-(D/E)XK nuclease family protein, partial [Deinococcales bacterium]
LAAGTPPDAIALVARDDATYGPPVRAIAWEYGLPVVTSYAVPLRDTPVGAWTATLVEVVREGLPFEAVARLLAHPLTGGLTPAVWDAARSDHPRGAAAWGALDGRTEALAWPHRGTRAELLACLHRSWDALGVTQRSQARRADVLAYQRLAAAAAALGAPTEQEVARSAFLHDLETLLTLLSVPADAGRSGVELHTPLAMYGARYAHVFVLGASEGVLPQRVADDPVLDFAERRAAAVAGLALEGAVEAAQREALSFRAVLWTLDDGVPGASLTMSYAEDEGIASPFFDELGLTPSAPLPGSPASPEETRRRRILRPPERDRPDPFGTEGPDPVLTAARHAWTVERRREEAAAPDAYDGVVGVPYAVEGHVFSATQLLDLGQCAFRWLCKVPLRLAEPEEAEEDVSPLLRGRLYHRALELALQAARAATGPEALAPAVREAALAALSGAFERAEAEENASAVPAWELRRGHHLDQLERVLRSESFLPEGAEVLAPSAVALEETGMWVDESGAEEPIPAPREMTDAEVRAAVAGYARAAKRAVAAGFDGVEIHGANGYLIQQFLNPHTNRRTDRWGGSWQARTRFALEVAGAVADAVGGERVGIRLSPYGVFNEMPLYDDIEETYRHLARRLGELGLVYLHLVDHSSMGAPDVPTGVRRAIRRAFPGALVLSGGYDLERANADLAAGEGDLVAFGRPFLANPDLVERFRRGAELNDPRPELFYTPGPEGYVDYPSLAG